MTLREIRERAGRSQWDVALRAGVSAPTLRLFEADPEAVRDVRKREALARVYEQLREEADR
jgi:DNA-binding XRE family transcriptional regulator